MDDERDSRKRPTRARQLRAVPAVSHLDAAHSPRTIGRVIAQTALMADTVRSNDTPRLPNSARGLRRFGWFL